MEQLLAVFSRVLIDPDYGAVLVASDGTFGTSRRAGVAYNKWTGLVWVLAGDTFWAIIALPSECALQFANRAACALKEAGFVGAPVRPTPADVNEVVWHEEPAVVASSGPQLIN